MIGKGRIVRGQEKTGGSKIALLSLGTRLAESLKAADQLEVAAAKVERNTAPNTWTLSGTERFVTRARSQAGPDIGVEASTTPSSEAFAKELRERATPPPPPR